MITLVTGGARSGKSRFALDMLAACRCPVFVATAEAFDDEMRERIRRHRAERDRRFRLVEEPLDLGRAVRSLPDDADGCLVDCVTVWLGNLVHRYGDDAATCAEIDALPAALADTRHDIVIVTNEVGTGIVPANADARRFRDLAGILNQKLAAAADRVVLVVCGLPMTLKEPA
jgi:adenosylcobinamide kinase/adenosylcobinamide-phosphate guanylyltransferase